MHEIKGNIPLFFRLFIPQCMMSEMVLISSPRGSDTNYVVIKDFEGD
ncbi:MAG: hypothetical protein BWY45_02370 [Euryarchaeota archaeon ADurb.Bin294]|nr:MAG: hypothetical protein BWY45_02370 [Euryarchaeota archaeon ADurb.Bin294]